MRIWKRISFSLDGTLGCVVTFVEPPGANQRSFPFPRFHEWNDVFTRIGENESILFWDFFNRQWTPIDMNQFDFFLFLLLE
jgi:hypothetical protein